MDEWTLNDLLECSVCLERLDTSSKVLPCQHTFCKKCLEEIVSTHKELRCPECRVPVNAQIDELPPNVLLMRILEGMKNSGSQMPKKKASSLQKHAIQVASTQGNQNPVCSNVDNSKISPAQKNNSLPTQPYARAIYDYISKEAGDLSFRKGEIIMLHRSIGGLWYQGECAGKVGIFPICYVQVMIPLPQGAACRALYDFQMANDEDEGCLSFRKNEIINVIRRVDENWAEGKLNDHIGIFPLAFVEMNNIAETLMKISINNQPGPSRIAPPTPNAEETTPLIPADHSGVISNTGNLNSSTQNHAGNISHKNATKGAPVTASVPASSTESGSTLSSSTTTPSSITPNSSSNTSSSSNSAPNSPPSCQPTQNNPNPFLPATQGPVQMIMQPPHVSNSSLGALPTTHVTGQQTAVGTEQLDTHCLWIPLSDILNFAHHPKEKRHSFSAVTPSHQTCPNSNKSPGEIINSQTTADIQNGQLSRQGSQRHKRSGSDMSSGLNLPASYIALYPYKPQKADELELKKGALYLVTERCQDGWFKGTSTKTQKSGVFPGNYVTLAKAVGTTQGQVRGIVPKEAVSAALVSGSLHKVVHQQKSLKTTQTYGRQLAPPDLPPRASSPSARHQRTAFQTSVWHSPQSDIAMSQKSVTEGMAGTPVGNASALPDSRAPQSASSSPVLGASTSSKSVEKVKEKKEKSGLIKRLTMKRCKSPPASASYSMDNPVFDENPGTLQVQPHPVHLRSGSCPSQLIAMKPENGGSNHRITSASVSARLKYRERPTVKSINFAPRASRPSENNAIAKVVLPHASTHKKSNSLDAGDTKKPRQLVPPVRERFRCIVPYPPNSEYELELKVGDIIYVHKKREDGWYKGTQQRTGRTGLFPASFVETY